jgi:hypothetical protein
MMGRTCSLDMEVESDHFEPRKWKDNIKMYLTETGYEDKG